MTPKDIFNKIERLEAAGWDPERIHNLLVGFCKGSGLFYMVDANKPCGAIRFWRTGQPGEVISYDDMKGRWTYAPA